jgi:hypothetical protein
VTTDERARRIGLNEAVFREVNERVESLKRDLGVPDERLLMKHPGEPARLAEETDRRA